MSSQQDPPDYDALAKRYLELWQEQIAKLAKDPGQLTDAAAGWSRWAASMVGGLAPNGTSSGTQSAPRSPAAAAPSRDGGVDLADVLGRLDAVERQLANIERRLAALEQPTG